MQGVSPGKKFLAYNNTIRGMERAIKERLLFVMIDGQWRPPPNPDHELVETRLGKFRKLLKNESVFCHPLGRQHFVGLFNGRKRVRYDKAVEVLENRGIVRSDGNLKYFMKYETYDFTTKSNPAPRGINPRSDEYLVETGRYIRPLEKKIYKDISRVFGYDVVMKGKNQLERGICLKDHWDSLEDPVCVMGDASRFEQSVSVPILEWEHSCYKLYYQGDPLFNKLLKWQLHAKGSAKAPDGSLKFKVHGLRASGDPNTALGNCLISAGLAHAFLAGINITEHKVFLDGDDIGFMFNRKDLEKFESGSKKWYSEMGFRMKFETTVDVFEQVDFCKSRPVWTPEGYLMVRSPFTGHSKDSVCKINLQSDTHTKRWYAAVGLGGISMTGGIPISESFYSVFVRSSLGAKALDILTDYDREKRKGLTRVVGHIHPETRHSFWKAFGIVPDEQIAIENEYDRITLGVRGTTDVARSAAHWCWGESRL